MHNNEAYIAFEGADGTGKSTLAKALTDHISHVRMYNGLTAAYLTCEPSKENEVASKLRRYCLDVNYTGLVTDDSREFMLMANRSIHLREIRQKLRLQPVVTDRSFVSGMVYAKVASQWSFDEWFDIGKRFLLWPDVIIHVVTDLQKISVRPGDIYDNANSLFHENIRNTFPDAFNFLYPYFLNTKTTYVVFENDFSVPVEENLKRLNKQLEATFGHEL